jgi:hypothetical protein
MEKRILPHEPKYLYDINICANQENQSAESVDSWLDILKLMERTPIT